MDSSKKLGEKCDALEPLPGESVGALAARKNKCFWEGSSMSAEN